MPLGDLEALQGVVKFPVRIKCATLAWNTLPTRSTAPTPDARSVDRPGNSAPAFEGVATRLRFDGVIVGEQAEASSPERAVDERRQAVVFIVALVIASRLILSVGGIIAAEVFEDDRAADFEVANAQVEAARQDVSSLRIVHQWYNWDAYHYENLSRQWLDVERPALPNVVTPEGGRAWNEFSGPRCTR